MGVTAAEPRGIRASARRVAQHASALMSLQRELAKLEMARKAGALGAGAGLGAAAAVVGVFALAVGIGTAIVALAIVLDLWLAFLIVFAVLLVLAALLGLLAVRSLKKGTPLAPEQAIEESQLTREALKARG
jgi:tetrahydromethanopterin S-methyltransferase subunit C